MKNKNNIKSPNIDSLRGLGKLGYTESGKLHSTIKNLTSSMEDVVKIPPSKKDKITCPACGNRLKANKNGKIQRHNRRFGNEICDGKIYGYVKPKIVKSVLSVTINEYVIVKNDTVAFTTYPWNFDFVDQHTLASYVIKDIILMDNEKIYLSLEGINDLIPSYIFVKNFIKL